ncbi:MAG: hypothetical protein AAGC81_16935 [Pseudomonadota bacterium]
MTGLIYLDIAIGVIFLLLIFSLFASAIQEAISGITGWRGNNLRRGVHWLIEGAVDAQTRDDDGKSDFDKIWSSPLIDSLHGPPAQATLLLPGTAKKRTPSYIPPEIFAKAVWDHLVKEKQINDLSDENIERLANSPNPLDKKLAVVLSGIKGGKEEAEKAIADWYDTSMARVSGWYVRNTRMVLFWIGLSLAAITNTDPMRYAGELRENEALRQSIVNKAGEIAALKDLNDVRKELGGTPSENKAEDLEQLSNQISDHTERLTSELKGLNATAGWSHCGKYQPTVGRGAEEGEFSLACLEATITGTKNITGYKAKQVQDPDPEAETDAKVDLTVPNPLFGWLLLAFGVMLGAQFWFDLLKRFMSIRSVGASLSGTEKKE